MHSLSAPSFPAAPGPRRAALGGTWYCVSILQMGSDLKGLCVVAQAVPGIGWSQTRGLWTCFSKPFRISSIWTYMPRVCVPSVCYHGCVFVYELPGCVCECISVSIQAGTPLWAVCGMGCVGYMDF